MYQSLMFSRLMSTNDDVDIAEDKEWVYNTYKNYFYVRLLEMFKYENLPDTIPQEILEIYLLSGGCCFFTQVNDEYYVFQGGLGGEPDVYYRPTLFTVTNPALGISEQYDISNDGVLCRNDKLMCGLDYLVKRTASLLAENVLTLKMADVVLRAIMMLAAPDDKTKVSAEEYLKLLKKGKMGVIADSQFLDGIKRYDSQHSSAGYITQFIEYHQYFLGSFFNEIGLNANFNMKRESIGKGEASLTQDTIFPIVDTMLSTRQEFIDKINKKYGLNITVDFSSIWKQNQLESQYELESIKNESDSSQLEENSSQLEENSSQLEENSSQLEEKGSDENVNDTEQVDTEQVNTEQVDTEQVDTEQVDTEQVDTEQVDQEQNNSEQLDTEQEHNNSEQSEQSEQDTESDNNTIVEVDIQVKTLENDDINISDEPDEKGGEEVAGKDRGEEEDS